MAAIDIHSVKKPYFIGIGGIGMSAIARMFLLEGKQVHGSDLSQSEVTDELKKFGAKIFFDQTKSHIETGTDLIVYTVAIPANHPELTDAREKGIQILSYPEILGIISKDKFTIAVAGTHGKTTTTAMIAKILIDAGLDPTVIIGSFLNGYNSRPASLRSGVSGRANFIAGKGKYLVVEACEYKRSFLNLSPQVAVITNIDDDHLDYYKNLKGVQKGFKEFGDLLEKDGILVTDTGHKNISSIVKGLQSTVLDYGSIEEVPKLKIPGKHNIQNAKAALVVAGSLGVPRDVAFKSLSGFTGTWRRFEYRGKTKKGIIVYDDYGHHPNEIKATLAGARELFPDKKITVVFQPHLYTRTKEHFTEFPDAFSLADQVLFAPIYAAREPEDKSVSSEKLAELMSKKGKKAKAFSNFKSIADELNKTLKKENVLITMGAGDVNKVADLMLE